MRTSSPRCSRTRSCGCRGYDEAIFNLHVPPKDSSLDTCAVLDTTKWPPEPVFVGGEPQTFGAGSTAVDAIIRERQPLLGLHGHIHESAGVKKIGRTTCVNPGSDYTDGTLRGAVIALRGRHRQGRAAHHRLTRAN